jgi:hypothetical protein
VLSAAHLRANLLVELGEMAGQRDEARPFDAILFNSALYLFDDPLRPVERYVRALNEHGVLILSIDTVFRGETAILHNLKPRYPMLDQTRVIWGDTRWSWVCTVLPSAREADRRDDRL